MLTLDYHRYHPWLVFPQHSLFPKFSHKSILISGYELQILIVWCMELMRAQLESRIRKKSKYDVNATHYHNRIDSEKRSQSVNNIHDRTASRIIYTKTAEKHRNTINKSTEALSYYILIPSFHRSMASSENERKYSIVFDIKKKWRTTSNDYYRNKSKLMFSFC